MKPKTGKSKSPIVGQPSYYGLVSRVAQKLGLNKNYISNVKAGRHRSPRVEEALEAERLVMDRERERAS